MFNIGPSQYGEGDYLLVISGSTYSAPYLKGWQDFKDHLRKIVKEQPGWADVLTNQNQRRGEKQGWCRLKHAGDAEAVYKIYENSKSILVHIWNTRRKNGGYELLKCNCSMQFGEVPDRGHSQGRCGIDINKIAQLSGQASVQFATQYPPTQSGYSYTVYPQAPAYSGAPAYPAQPLPTQTYSMSTNNLPMNLSSGASPYPIQPLPTQTYPMSTNNLPVNLSSGVVLTQACGIFIRNLDFKTTPEQFAFLLSSVGHPVDYKFHRDARTGGFKGVATATFASIDEAQAAVTGLNGRMYMNMILEASMDANATPVGRSTPIIVNGSTTFPVSKTCTFDITS